MSGKTKLNVSIKQSILAAVAKRMITASVDWERAEELSLGYLNAGYRHFYGDQDLHEAAQLLLKNNLLRRKTYLSTGDIIACSDSEFMSYAGISGLYHALINKPIGFDWHTASFHRVTVKLEGLDLVYPEDLMQRMAYEESCKKYEATFRGEFAKLFAEISSQTDSFRGVISVVINSTTVESLIAKLPELEELILEKAKGHVKPLLPATVNAAQVSSFLTNLKPIEAKATAV